jgi:hypothetical protein
MTQPVAVLEREAEWEEGAPESPAPVDPPKRGRGRPSNPRPEPQTHFDEVVIADARIVADMDIFIEHQAAAKLANGAKRRLKALMKEGGYDAGRYRVGQTVIQLGDLSSEGMVIGPWTAKSFRIIG